MIPWETDCLSSNPGLATCYLCDVKQGIYPPNFIICKLRLKIVASHGVVKIKQIKMHA